MAITQDRNQLDDLFAKLGISRWVQGIILEGLCWALILVLMFVGFNVVIKLVTRAMHKLAPSIFVVQKEKGGIIEDGF